MKEGVLCVVRESRGEKKDDYILLLKKIIFSVINSPKGANINQIFFYIIYCIKILPRFKNTPTFLLLRTNYFCFFSKQPEAAA